MSLRDTLRELSSRYSLIELHSELLTLMKEEYAALKEFFAPDVKRGRRAPNKQVQEAGQEENNKAQEPVKEESNKCQEPIEEQEAPPPRVIANTKIRIIKRETSETTPTVAEIPNSKDLKAWQKEQEKNKLDQLIAQKINPETLLTIESMKKWIEDEKKTFAYVAREYLGMPESKVADFAREHGIKSTISKKRAIVAAKNRMVH